MECSTCREALSARMDGEVEPVPAASTDEHLRACRSCREWHDRAIDLTRSLRVREATPVPDLTGAILDDAPVLVSNRGWGTRLGLGVVAVAQLGLALSQLFGTTTAASHAQHVPIATHLFNEGIAWNLALGVGLFWAAFHPRATAGMIPVLGGFVLVLLAYSTHDLITGAVPVSRVAGHGLLVAGLILLVLVNRRTRDDEPHGTRRTGTDSATDMGSTAPGPAGRSGRGRPPLRPASRHRAA
ncbi:zf-HC2 domain-containing protein [Actinophytocola gossypii]|uniref:Zf-HC2 domain-containing protein n=1 Tax=Actinophytocola gossypii TaxID=2812003 RepID=A0ABT2J2L9_9PSEU|nr:zf-HC2 domain-containing protein [Actinophytocola gossypii]MCT2582104.1 zf-HC2 domain-containing protein [Actinophytocola gossypii]